MSLRPGPHLGLSVSETGLGFCLLPKTVRIGAAFVLIEEIIWCGNKSTV